VKEEEDRHDDRTKKTGWERNTRERKERVIDVKWINEKQN
jgi:hypothetical protein